MAIVAGALLLAPGASAASVEATTDAAAIAGSITSQPGLVVGAGWTVAPSGPNAAGIGYAGLGHHLPTDGTPVGVLSSGDATLAEGTNDTQSAGEDNGTFDRGVNDLTVLRVDVMVPSWANCIGFDTVFYSEEFPEWVGSAFNDAF